jgi:hypothetical protein
MPPKKGKAKKGKKAEDTGEDGGVLTPEMTAKMFEAANRSLIVQLGAGDLFAACFAFLVDGMLCFFRRRSSADLIFLVYIFS